MPVPSRVTVYDVQRMRRTRDSVYSRAYAHLTRMCYRHNRCNNNDDKHEQQI